MGGTAPHARKASGAFCWNFCADDCCTTRRLWGPACGQLRALRARSLHGLLQLPHPRLPLFPL
jgi:hypothetical protein